MRRTARVLGDVALSVGAVAGLLCLVATVAALVFHVQPLIFRSGSMSPGIPAGSLGFAHRADALDLKVGDVVSVPYGDSHVTHRIVSITPGDHQATLRLKGDANKAPDSTAYPVRTADRLWFSVPYAGSVIAWLSRTPGVFVLALYLALMLVVIFRRGRPGSTTPPGSDECRDDDRFEPRRRVRTDSRRSARVVMTGVLALLPLGVTSPTWAAWTDRATVTGATLTAYKVESQQAPLCTDKGGVLGLLGYAELTWPNVNASYEYAYTITRVSNGTVAASGVVAPTGAAGSTETLDVTAALLSLSVGNVNFDVKVTARLKASPSWTAASSTTTRVHSANLVLGLSARCGSA